MISFQNFLSCCQNKSVEIFISFKNFCNCFSRLKSVFRDFRVFNDNCFLMPRSSFEISQISQYNSNTVKALLGFKAKPVSQAKTFEDKMIWFHKIWFLTLVLFIEQRLSLFNQKHPFPKSMTHRGYLGTFRQNLTGYPVKFDAQVFLQDSMNKLLDPPLPPERTINFCTGSYEPFVFSFVFDTGENGKDDFVVWGPMFSMIYLAAAQLNYR